MNRFVVDPAHIDVLLSLAINGPSDHPSERPWPTPSAGEITGDPGPLTRRDAAEVGAALLAMCVSSVRHYYAAAELPRLPGPDPLPDPGQYEWSDLGKFLTVIEGLVAISFYEFNSNCSPGWYASAPYALCNRLRARLVASLPGCSDARLHWTTDAVVGRGRLDLSLEQVLSVSEVRSDGVDDLPPSLS